MGEYSKDRLSNQNQGSHTNDLKLDITYPDARILITDLNRSNLFVQDGPPQKHDFSLVYKYRPTRIGPKGMFIAIRTSKVDVGYQMARKKDIDIDERDILTCTIVIRVNASALAGSSSHIDIATTECLPMMADNFNDICRKISPVLGNISMYRIDRTDPCVNVILHDLSEIAIDAVRTNGWDGITPWHIVQLVKRSDTPRYFHVGEYARETADRSHVMKNRSCRVNIYCKGMDLQDKYPNSPEIELAMDILRIEIQMFHNKIRQVVDDRSWDVGSEVVFSSDWNVEMIDRYWNRIVGTGDWWCRELAEKKIRSMGWSRNKTDRLIGVLNLVEMYGGVGKARCRLDGRDRIVFAEGVRELEEIGVNAVLVPAEWKLKWIPNVWEKWMRANG